MSIAYSGTFRRSGGVFAAIAKQYKSVNLKAVKKVTVTFDPFAENVKSTREFLFLLSSPRASKSNTKCSLKANIVCDRQPSEIVFTLNETGRDQAKVKEVRFLSNNLTTLELLQLCNKHISSLAPIEDESPALLTKSEKQKLTARKKK